MTDSALPQEHLQESYQAALAFIDRLEGLAQFPERLDITSGMGRIWDLLCEQIGQAVTVTASALLVVEEQSREFVLQAVHPEDCRGLCDDEINLQIACGTFSWVINRRQPALLTTLAAGPEQSVMLLPLATSRRTLGAVMILTPVSQGAMTSETLRVLSVLAKQGALVLENAILYDHLRSEHEALKKAQRQIVLSEKLATIAKLTGGACHEILNPLNIISGHLQLMAIHPNIDASQHRKLAVMKSQSDRIAAILLGLNQLAREPNQRIEPVRVNDLIDQVLASAGVDLKPDRITLVKDLSQGLPLVTADQTGLTRVVCNLVVNACEAMDDGGTLTIATRSLALGAEREAGVEIGVGDSGPGIAQETINHVFDPFFTTKTAGHHPGLGLTQCLAIVEEHGGTLAVESAPGQGTRFTVRLPLCHRAANLHSANGEEATRQ
jgi:signal transduction histidine kinase